MSSNRSFASSPSTSGSRRPSSPRAGASSSSVANASVATRSIVAHAEDVLSVTSGSAHDANASKSSTSRQQQAKRRYVPESTSTTGTLFVILLAFLLSSITATVVLSNHAYNYTAAPHWILVGSTTATSASFRVRNALRLVVKQEGDDNTPVFDAVLNPTDEVTDGTLAQASVSNLQPSTTYYYFTFVNELSTTALDAGSFITAPRGYDYQDDDVTNADASLSTQSTLAPNGFRIAAAGCAWTGSASSVFTEIANEPDLMMLLHLGDLHYEDLTTTDVNIRIQAYDKVMASPTQRRLLNTVSLAYMYDDHDFLGNDSGENTSSVEARTTALQSYRLGVPHYPLATSNLNATQQSTAQKGNYQAFSIGNVRFIMPDLRSESTAKRIYSDEQRDWLFRELAQAAASNYDFVILVSTKPWVGAKAEGEDNWMGHAKDRRALSAYITQVFADKQNLLMISSDAHMLAFDDGSNTYYGDGGGSSTGAYSFPILMSGPLDRLGSAKGGPFSDGCHAVEYERNHQYSVIEYQPSDGSADGTACLLIRAYSIDYFGTKSVVFTKQLCGQIFQPSNPGVGSCQGSALSRNTQAVLGLAVALLLTVVLLETCILGDSWLHRLCLFSLALVMFVLTVVVGLVIPVTALGIDQFDTFAIAMIALFQIIVVSMYLAYRVCKERCGASRRRK